MAASIIALFNSKFTDIGQNSMVHFKLCGTFGQRENSFHAHFNRGILYVLSN